MPTTTDSTFALAAGQIHQLAIGEDTWTFVVEPLRRGSTILRLRRLVVSASGRRVFRHAVSLSRFAHFLGESTLIHTAENASAWGHRYGRCVFCCRTLSDERSLTVGYGQVCANRHRLPWGDRSAVPVNPYSDIADAVADVATTETSTGIRVTGSRRAANPAATRDLLRDTPLTRDGHPILVPGSCPVCGEEPTCDQDALAHASLHGAA